MGMSTHIQAFIPDTDLDYQRHKKVLLVCLEANVELPKETAQYFGCKDPYKGVLDEKLEIDLEVDVHYEIYSNDWSSGFEVDLNKLPKGVTKLRVYNSF